jgi:hypothetical protein
MEPKRFRVVTITAKASRGRRELCETFNQWVGEDEEPLATVHTRSFHDTEAPARRY